jgi:hypothetical protein
MDVEFNPDKMYQYGMGWNPDISTVVPAGLCLAGTQLAMTSSMAQAWNGAYSQKPSHCSQVNALKIDIRPSSSAVYGAYFNMYFNYTHTWNWNALAGPIYHHRGIWHFQREPWLPGR